ncbi:hypothetical protein AKJ63_00375 [candidate division MSBL1 archaeon SCGC-AAA259D18]|uniref:Uncharacterized protein n=1 Tax=candidate division MSBL1 archaeon SCGC-AAA259D18 TaxID=1698262 RepID=A0A133UCL9_9EURY|nr:hypothetical protein AKJ63_00375 [candidate division MSBL1 archaeon SCGC-AAA259D18]
MCPQSGRNDSPERPLPATCSPRRRPCLPPSSHFPRGRVRPLRRRKPRQGVPGSWKVPTGSRDPLSR